MPEAIATPVSTIKKPLMKPGLSVQYTKPGPPSRITALVYGVPGIGKTQFAATFPKPLFIDMRAGLATVRHMKVPFIRPKTYVDIMNCAVPANVQDYHTIVLDHLTEMARFLMEEVLTLSTREEPVLKDWGRLLERLTKITVAFTAEDNLRQHIVFVAEEQADKDEETGKILITPDVPGKFARRISSWFDCVFHMRVATHKTTGTKGRYLLTQPDTLYPAKTRFRELDRLEQPDFNVIWEKITK